MCIPSRYPHRRRESGLSLIELVMFIVIVSIAVTGVLMLMNLNTRHSVDPLLQKQAVAIAEALLEEVEQMPFTTCDPDGYNALDNSCARLEAMGPETAFGDQTVDESRGSAVAPFDNVNDYKGFTLAGGATDIGNATNVVVPAGYSASVAVVQDGAFGNGVPLPAAAVLRISVTVTYEGGNVVLEGYRTQYAPTPTQ